MDEKPELSETPKKDPVPKSVRFGRLKAFLITRRGKVTIAVVVMLAIAVLGVGVTDAKYKVLGPFFRPTISVEVLDAKTGQPIPGAAVILAGINDETGTNGVVSLDKLRPGKSQLEISKRGYDKYAATVKVGLRSRALEPVRLKSNGIDVVFSVTDKITGEKVDGAEVLVGQNRAVSKDGKALISLLPEDGTQLQAKVSKTGYYLETNVDFEVKTGAEHSVLVVPTGKVYYLSNRTGRVDLYESNLDGSDTIVVLAGTGRENAETGILPSIRSPHQIVLVANREGKSAIYLYNAQTKRLSKIDDGVGFYDYRAWVGDTLVYHKYDSSQDCLSIKTYRPGGGASTVVVDKAKAKGCPIINAVAGEYIFYSVRHYNAVPPNTGFFALKIGSEPRKVNDDPANYVARRVKQTILYEYYNYSVTPPEIWYQVDLPNLSVSKLAEEPSSEAFRAYNDSPNGNASVFIEERDGKTELYVSDAGGGNERKLTSMGSVNQFVQWIGERYIVFSSTKSDENALYIVSPVGGQPVKIGDFYRSGGRGGYGGGYNPVY